MLLNDEIHTQPPEIVQRFLGLQQSVIRQQGHTIQQLEDRIQQLEIKIHELEARISKNSSNSGKPPSTKLSLNGSQATMEDFGCSYRCSKRKAQTAFSLPT